MRALTLLNLGALLALPFALHGCVVVVPFAFFLHNTTALPVPARLHYREWVHPDDTIHSTYRQHFARGLRYSLQPLKISLKASRALTVTLPVSATDTAATFTVPPYATLLLEEGYGHSPRPLPREAKLYLQPVGEAVQVVTEENFRQSVRFRRGAFCYDIRSSTP